MISIIYAHRNRDTERIRISLESLRNQFFQNFEVVFVDYGSENLIIRQLEELAIKYDFVKFHSLQVPQLLWNKSKALNYGILQARFHYIFIADVDLIFHPGSINLFSKLADPESFSLFELAYLNKRESQKLNSSYNFDELVVSRTSKVNGMILVSKKALLEVNGLDEFFHFYGAEDEDLFSRLEKAGYKRRRNSSNYFCHNWHQSFSGSEDKLLTGNPRIKNIMRINQRHFQKNKERGVIKPLRQIGIGEVVNREEGRTLQNPDKIFKINNILAQVEHFLREELPSYEGEVVEAVFVEDPYFHSLKHKIKRALGKQTQPYCTMKELNDILLKEILFNYRNHNYSFVVSKDLKKITFCIKL